MNESIDAAENVVFRALYHAQNKLIESHLVPGFIGSRRNIGVDLLLHVQICLLQFQKAFEI